MISADKSVRQIVYSLCLGINQLIDKGYSESPDIIADKIFNGELIDYIITTYKDDDIFDLNFHKSREEDLIKLSKLLPQYDSVIKHYGISNNGLILASSVFANILFE